MKVSDRIRVVLALLMGFSTIAGGWTARPGHAQTIRPDAFAYGMRIDTVGLQPMQSVVLTPNVYENLTRSDLGDLRVFNAAGQPVPHAFHFVPEEPESPGDIVSLPVFPMYGRPDQPMGDLGIQVRRTTQGTLVQIDESAEQRAPDLRAYIVDASRLDDPVKGLAFFWGSDPEDLLVPVTVETSEDLLVWQAWGSPGTLASVRHAGQVLVQNTLDLPVRKARYYRIGWPAGTAFPPLDRLEATTAPGRPDVERLWIEVTLQENEPNVFTAQLPGAIPVERVQIEFPDTQSFVRVTLASSENPNGPWVAHHEGLAYRLQAGDASWIAPPIAIYRISNRYWRLTIQQENGGAVLGTPSLRFGWTPARVLFLPQGEAPFTLAFGNAEAEAAAFASSELMGPIYSDYPSVFDLGPASLESPIELGGAARLEPSTELPWQQIALWGALLLGVAVLGWLALRLMRSAAT